METLFKMIMIAMTAIVFENTILTRAIGTSTMLLASKNKKDIVPFGLSITYICTTTSAISFLVDKFLVKNEISVLYMPLIYVGIIGFVYIVTLLVMWKWIYKLFVKVKKFIHISSFNCAVLGALFLNSMTNKTFLGYLVFGLGTGIGFFGASYLVFTSYDKLNSTKVPQAFRGFPAIMVYIGILSMVFFVLTGKIPQN